MPRRRPLGTVLGNPQHARKFLGSSLGYDTLRLHLPEFLGSVDRVVHGYSELEQFDVMRVHVHISEVIDLGNRESLFYFDVGAGVPELGVADAPFAPGDSCEVPLD